MWPVTMKTAHVQCPGVILTLSHKVLDGRCGEAIALFLMTGDPAFERPTARITPIGKHAAQDLRFIRETMERASSLTAFPGWGLAVIGVTALLAAVLAARTPNDTAWLGTWLVEAVLAIALGSAAMAFKSRASGSLFQNGAWRRFALAFCLPIIAAAVLTARWMPDGLPNTLPGMWLLLYGVGIAVGGLFSVAAVRAMGVAFMLLGAVALFVPGVARDAWMASGFGVLHIAFGLWIARRHGG